MNKKKLEQYAELQAQKDTLDEQMKALKVEIQEDMDSEELDKIEADFGTFYFTTRKSWTYPDYVKKAEEGFKKEKKRAEESGDATFKESRSLAFRGAKKDE